ncbi:hypothetical protein LPJ67_003886 [Coemansia sp. RSA 1938]|nr:hypothetical protein LPJ67_003886 [Coemansia sp. RSA 1938]
MPSTRPFTQKPKGQSTNETIDQIDFEKVAAEDRKWDLPTSQLPSDIGTYEQISIKVSQVQINPVEAFSGTGAAESGLLALSEADHTASSIDCKISAELTVPASLKRPSDTTLDVFACHPLADGEKIVLYLHGGVYKFGSAASHHVLVGQIANHATGDSAGSNLALSLTVLLQHTGHHTHGLLLLLPWVDLTTEQPSIQCNTKYDFLCAPLLELPLNPARTFYAPGCPLSPEMITKMAHPLVSPVYADFAKFLPMLIQASKKEIIINKTSQLYKNIAAHNPNAKCGRYIYECYADMIHVFHQFLDLPDAQYAIAKAGEFIKAL